ncbi:expressed unknown protein [Seminavis robusta]|uniref:Uncharacterized protein n=1 Tax=Seminavis robusta TaxID=568900 RepID=A0A9N8EKU9_9STRA|nr:expressed unknown protein [Seminavis robusta]|eukprot:Sro1276_g258620.1 n/a (988) ;mRNA; f:24830-27937
MFAACPNDQPPSLSLRPPSCGTCMNNTISFEAGDDEDEISSFIGDIVEPLLNNSNNNRAPLPLHLPAHVDVIPNDLESLPQSSIAEPDNNNNNNNNTSVTVSISQVTLFPSSKLKQSAHEWDVPHSECLLLSTFGMCLDEDQMLSFAALYQDQQSPKPYNPPPVTWSQPVIIVSPEDEDDKEEDDNNQDEKEDYDDRCHSPCSDASRKSVTFQEDVEFANHHDDNHNHNNNHNRHRKKKKRSSKSNNLMRMILLHGRVARALGIKHGDCVTVQLEGQAKRQVVRASVDDRASFNVVMEADCADVMSSSYLKTVQHQRRVLYFEGAMGVSDPAQGIVAGTGFCIYSCRESSLCDIDDTVSSDDMPPSHRGSRSSSKGRLPVNKTELVSSYRYLGRPYCTNHAEYSALIEGLEWLFRFQFDEVFIVGAPEVVAALRKRRSAKYNRRRGVYQDEDDESDAILGISQIRKANAIAQSMIEKASNQGLEIRYIGALEDESWEAGDLAEKAIDVARNETQVLWENIREAKPMRPKSFQMVGNSMSYSADSILNINNPAPEKPYVESDAGSEDWSLLKGEEVLDEEFQIPAALIKEEERKTGIDECSDDTEVTGHHLKPEREGTHLAPTRGGVQAQLQQQEEKLQQAARQQEEEEQQDEHDEVQHLVDELEEQHGHKTVQHLVHQLEQQRRHKKHQDEHDEVQHLVDELEQQHGHKTEEEHQDEHDEVQHLVDELEEIEYNDAHEVQLGQEPVQAVDAKETKSDGEGSKSDDNGKTKQQRGGSRWRHLAKALRHKRIKKKISSNQSVASQRSQNSVESTWMVSSRTKMPSASITITHQRQNTTANPAAGEEKFDYLYDGDDDETKCEEARYFPGQFDQFDMAPPSPPTNGKGASNPMCFLLDSGLLQSAQVVADDMARLFGGSPYEGAEKEEEAKVGDPAQSSGWKTSMAPIPSSKSFETSSSMPQYAPSLLHPQHREDPLPPPNNYKRQYAYV